MQDSVQSSIASQLDTRLAIFTLFIVALVFLFVIVWIPFINGLTTEVNQTKKLLLLIPVELLSGLKNVALLLKQDNGNQSGVGTKNLAITGADAGTKKSTNADAIVD